MITVAFDLYNENEFVRSYEKTFVDEESSRHWFNSQMGHPYLCYCNERIIDNKYIETIDKKPMEDSKIIFVTRWGSESFPGTFKKGNFICEKTGKVYEGSMDIVRWKYNGS